MIDAAGKRDVVGDESRLDRDALGPCEFGGDIEVETIPRVVLDDEERAARTGRWRGSGQNGVEAR